MPLSREQIIEIGAAVEKLDIGRDGQIWLTIADAVLEIAARECDQRARLAGEAGDHRYAREATLCAATIRKLKGGGE